MQFNYKNQSPLFFHYLFCFVTFDLGLVDGCRTSRFHIVNRPFIFACESRRCIGYPDSESPSPLYLLLLFLLLLLHPSSTFPAGEPGASDQMEFFHFIFPALCTISNSIVPTLIPVRFRAVFHVHTRTFVFLLAVR